MAQVGRKPREPLPKGEEAEKELERQRRNARRALRKAKKKAAEEGVPFVDPEQPGNDSALPPADFEGIPSADQLKEQFWGAFYDLGGQAGLVAWGRRYPKEFYAIWARMCLPKASSDVPQANSLEALLAQIDGDD